MFRRDGYATRKEAQAALDRIRELLNISDDEADRDAIAELIDGLGRQEKLPEVEEVRRQLHSGQALGSRVTVGEWLDKWLPQQTHLRRSTFKLYGDQVRLYLKPKIGHLRLARLTVGHLTEMFAKINDDNDRIEAENADRRALEQLAKVTRKRAEKRELRAQLAEMPPYRRPVFGASQQRIKGTLRKAINDAIVQQVCTFNPAMHVPVQAKKAKGLVWTAERANKWQETGERPGPVMVWTPQQAGVFLDHVAEHAPEFEALWHLLTFRGPRRGEVAGLGWTEVNLSATTVQITAQITEVGYEMEEGAPKSEASERTIPLDATAVALLRTHRKRQVTRQLELGGAWVESGKVFTAPDGSALRPSWITDEFRRLYTAAGLPPIRLHDLRHTAATLMLAAKVPMKIVQETLGHSALAVTADLYTSVLPELAQAAAEDTVSIVPRAPKGTLATAGHPRGTRNASSA